MSNIMMMLAHYGHSSVDFSGAKRSKGDAVGELFVSSDFIYLVCFSAQER